MFEAAVKVAPCTCCQEVVKVKKFKNVEALP